MGVNILQNYTLTCGVFTKKLTYGVHVTNHSSFPKRLHLEDDKDNLNYFVLLCSLQHFLEYFDMHFLIWHSFLSGTPTHFCSRHLNPSPFSKYDYRFSILKRLLFSYRQAQKAK